VAVRAIKDGRLGFASANRPDARGAGQARREPPQLDHRRRPRRAFSSRRSSRPNAESKSLAVYDERTAKLQPRDLVAFGERALAAVKEKFPEIAFDLSLRRSISEVRLDNSRGARFEDKGTSLSFSLEFNRTRDNDVMLDGDGFAGVWENGELDKAVARVIEKLERARTDVKLERTGQLPVLFSSGGSYLVWSPLFQGLSGKAIQTGTSPIREKRGERILDPRVELTDDARSWAASAARPSTTRAYRGARASSIADGHARGLRPRPAHRRLDQAGADRQRRAPGRPRRRRARASRNVLIRGGPRSEKDLLASIDYGPARRERHRPRSGATRSRARSRTRSNLAYLVRKGEIVGRVKDVSIAGNSYEVLKDRLGELGQEIDRSPGSMHIPAVLVSGLSVVAKT